MMREMRITALSKGYREPQCAALDVEVSVGNISVKVSGIAINPDDFDRLQKADDGICHLYEFLHGGGGLFAECEDPCSA